MAQGTRNVVTELQKRTDIADLDRLLMVNPVTGQPMYMEYGDVFKAAFRKNYIPLLSDLQTYVRGDVDYVIVTEKERGGPFRWFPAGSGYSHDGINVFSAEDGGVWVRSKVGEFSGIEHQQTRPSDSTSWVRLYAIFLPERGGADPDISASPNYDFATFKGKLFFHGLAGSSPNGSRGERFLNEYPFECRFIGWRGIYRIDESYLYIDGKLKISDNLHDVIRIVKKSRLSYEVHVRQDVENLVFGVETNYHKASGAIISIDGDTVVGATVTSPEAVIWNKDNYLPYQNRDIQKKLIISNPPMNVIYPVVVDGNGGVGLKQWETEGSDPTRTGVERTSSYTTSPYGWGTATTGLPDSITIQQIGDRNFLRFKLERNQETRPERSELSSISPLTTYGGVNDIRWFGANIRVNYFNDTDTPIQDNTILFQFLPDYFTVPKPPCQFLSIEGGRYIWRMASNYKGNSNIEETTKITRFDLGPVSWNSFEKWVVQCKFNYNDGFLKVWKNDVLLIDFEGHTTWDDVGGYVPYIKFGIYKPFWGNRPEEYVTPTNIVVVDHMDTRWGDVDSDYDSIAPLPIEDYEKLNIDINSNSSDFGLINTTTANITVLNVGGISETNADSLLNSGWYTLASNNGGIPVAVAGILSVGRAGGNVSQFYFTTDNRVYARVRTSGVWGNWSLILKEANLENITLGTAEIGTANITNFNLAGGTVFPNFGAISSTTSDNLLLAGWYQLTSGNAGIPVAEAGILSVSRSGSTVSQLYVTNGNVIYFRSRTSGVWQPWKRLAEFYSGTTGSRPTATFTGQQYFDNTLGQPIWWNGSNWVDATGTTV